MERFQRGCNVGVIFVLRVLPVGSGMFKLMMITAGGGIGALLRYWVSGWGQKLSNGSFPTGTLIVNLAGCFLIGFLGAVFAGPHLIRAEYRTAVLVGFLGAFTTFSSFGWETFALANAGQLRFAVLNILLSNGLGLAVIWFGYRIGVRSFGA